MPPKKNGRKVVAQESGGIRKRRRREGSNTGDEGRLHRSRPPRSGLQSAMRGGARCVAHGGTRSGARVSARVSARVGTCGSASGGQRVGEKRNAARRPIAASSEWTVSEVGENEEVGNIGKEALAAEEEVEARGAGRKHSMVRDMVRENGGEDGEIEVVDYGHVADEAQARSALEGETSVYASKVSYATCEKEIDNVSRKATSTRTAQQSQCRVLDGESIVLQLHKERESGIGGVEGVMGLMESVSGADRDRRRRERQRLGTPGRETQAKGSVIDCTASVRCGEEQAQGGTAQKEIDRVGEDEDVFAIRTHPRELQHTPEGMRVVRRDRMPSEDHESVGSGGETKKRRERRARNLKDVMEEAGEEVINILPRFQLIEKVNALKGEVGKMKEDYYSVMVSLKLTQRELERVRAQLTEQTMVVDSLREARNARRKEMRQVRGQGKAPRRRKYEIAVQECFYGFARFMYDRILHYAKLKTSELCFDSESAARSWKNRSEIIEDSREDSMFVVGEKEVVPRCPMEVTSEMRSYTPSTEGGSDELLKYVVEKEISGERWESIRSAGRKDACVEGVSDDRCLRQRMKQTLSDVVGVRKRAARDKMFSILGYDLIARRSKPKEGTELDVELKKQLKEAREKLRGDAEDEVEILVAWRMRAIEDLVYSRSKVNMRFKEFESNDMYFRNAMAVEVLEEFMGYQVGKEKDGAMQYVDGTVMHLARLDAWIGCVVSTMESGVGRGGQRQLLFSTLYGKYLPHAVEEVLKTAWEAVKMYRMEFRNEGVCGGEQRQVCGNSERRATVALRIPSTGKLYLVVREDYFLKHMTRRLGAVLDCFVGSCQPEEEWFERLKSRRVEELPLMDVEVEEDDGAGEGAERVE